jgi:GT2 family glycosyltransferase/SAM-dependent methyltransferase
MKFGRSVGVVSQRIPGLGAAVRRIQLHFRRRRAERRLRRLSLAGQIVPGPKHMAGWAATPTEYAAWIATVEIPRERLRSPAAGSPDATGEPFFSVLIPVYRVKPEFLRRTLDSLKHQQFTRWEACIACADPGSDETRRLLETYASRDSRYRVEFLETNGGISANSNAALAMARGPFVALLDHDDELAPFALQRMHEAIEAEAEADFLYSDKDSIDENSTLRQNALFKPEWSPEILFSVNYLTHFNVMRTSLVQDVGGFRSETDGAQDWDIFLRVCHASRRIVRVPGVHYHWRIHAASTSTGIAAKPYALEGQIRALEDHVARLGLSARIVPNDDSGFHLRWQGQAGRSAHVIVDGYAADAEAIRRATSLAAAAQPGRVTLVCEPGVTQAVSGGLEPGVEVVSGPERDRITIVNQLVASDLEHTRAVVLLSAAAADLSAGWLGELSGWVTGHPEIGFASGLVLDAEGTVVEAGLVVDRFGTGSPMFRGSPLRQWGWFGGPLWYRNCTAATPWALAINADDWVAAGGLDEQLGWQSACVGLCRAIGRAGKRGVVDPHARVALQPGPLPPVPAFHDSLRDDPYFHPAFASAVPLTMRAGDPETIFSPPPARRMPKLKLPRLAFPARAGSGAAAAQGSYAADAMALAGINTCTLADLQAPQQHPERVGRGVGAGWCNWYLPPFDNPYYGGVMTILRYAEYLKREQGINQRFLICGGCDAAALAEKITAAFPALAGSTVRPLDSAEAIQTIPAADYSIATLWTTAYVLQKVRNTGLKFYFIQDWEPLFYPAGSTSAQAELTYDFGFYGIANTRTLRRLYEEEHGGLATHFAPQIDPAVFHGSPLRSGAGPKRLFFYGRPGHPRNGFELAAVALRGLKERLGERVQILCAGSPWNPRQYGLEGVIESLGLLRYEETAELYRSCHVGFVMMMTRHPSYLPFEFMGCGGLLVSNDNRANHWLLEDGRNCLLAPPSGPAIAERLAYAVEHFEELLPVRRAGWEVIRRRHSDWDAAFAGVWDFMDGLSQPRARRTA